MFSKANLSKEKKITITIFVMFLLLILFHRWQLLTSSGYLFLGDENYKRKNYNESLKNYKYAAAINGDRSTIYFAKLKRAKIFFLYGFLNEAEKELNEAIKEVKNDFMAYEIMGDVHYAKRNISDSISYYKKSIELKDKEEINIKLAKSFMAEGKINKANDIFLKLYLKSNNKSEVIYYLGLINFYENGLYNDYFQEIEKSNNIDYKEKVNKIKKHSDNYSNIKNEIFNNILIADLYNRINEPYFAIIKSRLVTEKNPNYRDAWIVLGKANFIIGDYKKAYDHFNKAFELDSHNPEIYFWLGSVCQKLGNDFKAEELMNKYKALVSEF